MTEGTIALSAEQPKVLPGSHWRGRSGRLYEVITVANAHALDKGASPVTVVFKDRQGRVWARQMADWWLDFTILDE